MMAVRRPRQTIPTNAQTKEGRRRDTGLIPPLKGRVAARQRGRVGVTCLQMGR